MKKSYTHNHKHQHPEDTITRQGHTPSHTQNHAPLKAHVRVPSARAYVISVMRWLEYLTQVNNENTQNEAIKGCFCFTSLMMSKCPFCHFIMYYCIYYWLSLFHEKHFNKLHYCYNSIKCIWKLLDCFFLQVKAIIVIGYHRYLLLVIMWLESGVFLPYTMLPQRVNKKYMHANTFLHDTSEKARVKFLWETVVTGFPWPERGGGGNGEKTQVKHHRRHVFFCCFTYCESNFPFHLYPRSPSMD